MRLDIERQRKLEPERMKHAKLKIEKLGFIVYSFGGNRLEFNYKGSKIMFYPYSGWASGKTIKDGRGLEKLLNQLKDDR